MSVLARGVRNAFRNSVRTFSIIVILGLSVGLALTMLLARHAVQTKIDSVQASIGNTVNISPAGVRGADGGGDALTGAELAKVKAMPHIVALTETLNDRLTATDTNLQSNLDLGNLGARAQRRQQNGQAGGFGAAGGGAGGRTFTPPIVVVGTNDPTNLQTFAAGGNVTLTSGAAFPVDSNDNVALVGTGLATKNNLNVGSTFQAYGTDFTVAGIFDAGGNRFTDSTFVAPLATVQRLSGQADAVTAAVVQVDSITNVTPTTTAIKASLGTAADVTSQADTSAQALEPLKNIKSISLYSLAGAVAAGAVIIFLTMLMIVRERRREIGVLKAIGASNFTVMRQFMAEAVTFTLAAAAIGLIIGVVGGNPVTKLLVNNSTNSAAAATGTGQGGANIPRLGGAGGFGGAGGGRAAAALGGGRATGVQRLNLTNIHVAIGWNVLLYGLAAAVVIALAGSAIPSLLLARVRPAEVLRAD
ncbi:MAG: FtsX-like permease family protein [Actinomycetota bacterium]|nr:FtsX-like permease family protein [Actinomycetota bacterium]